ncbi:unnamed protein product [Rangifer tarandus platyrhynchus]|uniref:Uncharacterized protein n=1 Tax=Rangifer tarandus platyrhynchus TaxID=3082113 RepID=A0AC60A4M4_RANTA
MGPGVQEGAGPRVCSEKSNFSAGMLFKAPPPTPLLVKSRLRAPDGPLAPAHSPTVMNDGHPSVHGHSTQKGEQPAGHSTCQLHGGAPAASATSMTLWNQAQTDIAPCLRPLYTA